MSVPSLLHGCAYPLPKTWDDPTWDPYRDPEPLPVEVVRVAELCGLDPRDLDYHVEAVHGWESHDGNGYGGAVVMAARCLAAMTAPECAA